MSGTFQVRQHDASQNAIAVQDVLRTAQEVITSDEEVVYVAMQDQKSPTVRKAAAIATTNRIILFRPQMVGSFNFEDKHWMDVEDVHLKQGMLFSGLTIDTIHGVEHSIDNLNKEQARKLYSIAQQYEHEWRERRRQRQIEEERARAGGVTIQAGAPQAQSMRQQPSADDPTVRLARAKSMLDQGLITEAEYDETKKRILSEL